MKDITEMSDEEIMAIDDSTFDAQYADTTKEDNVEETTEETNTDESSDNENISEDTENIEENSSNITTNTNEETSEESESTSPNSSEEDGEPKKDPINYEEFYNRIMSPLKANGKTIPLNNSDEVIQLMQQGANYTKKMQKIAPYRKTLMMLENNGLLDEDKLNFLIDIDKKNPEAIKKLLTDANIDPYEMDTSEENTYTPGNYRVSDEEARFTSAIEDLQQVQGGTETLTEINSWDKESKGILWNNPEIMNEIHTQRSNGVYDKIINEIERQKIFGNISPSMPFLEAYKKVGDYLLQQQNGQRPIDIRASRPKSNISNNSRARAASTVKSSKKVAKQYINPLAMSDDEFLKSWEGRL